MDEDRIAAADKPPALAVVVSSEDFASTLAALAAAEDLARCKGEPGRRVLVVDDAEVLGPRGMRILAGSGFEVELDGRTIYLVEGESSLHPIDLLPPPREFEGKLVMNEPAPHQEAGFYRRFEHRRRDGSMARGRRR